LKTSFKNFGSFLHQNFKLLITASLLFSSFSASVSYAQSDNEVERKNKILVAYLIGFVKFIDFPEVKSNEYNFCISGSQKLADSVMAAARRSTPDKIVNSYVITNPEKFSGCNIIYFSKNSDLNLKDYANADKSKFISISDSNNFIKNSSGMIEIKESAGRYTFAIDVAKIEKQGFKVSSKLVELAEEVF
jgi:hypothetical protein